MPAASPGAALTWDANGASTGSGGSGIWDTGTSNWTADAGASFTIWSNTTPDSATFASTAGTVTLATDITAAAATMSTSGYVLQLDGNDLTVNGAFAGGQVVNSTTRNDSTVTSTFKLGAGSTFANVRGNIDLVVTGGAIGSGTNDFTGSFLFKPTVSSNLTVTSNSHLGSADTVLTIDATTANAAVLFGLSSGRTGTYDHDIVLLPGTSTVAIINPNGPFNTVLTGNISGGTTVANGVGLQIHSGASGASAQGALVLAGSNSYYGLTTLTKQQTALILAHNDALGNSSGVSLASSLATAGSVGFSGGINLANTSTINISAASAQPGGGHGNIHNWDGANTVSSNILWTTSSAKYLGAETGSKLTLLGTVGHATDLVGGIVKLGYGEISMRMPTRAGSVNGGQNGNATDIREGTLTLDFSAGTWETSPGVMSNMINNGLATDMTTGTAVSQLYLSGGTLEIIGKQDMVIEQYFRNETGNTLPVNSGLNAFQVKQGASAIRVTQNGATAVTVGTGKLLESYRAVGGTVDFTLPTAGSIIMQNTGTAGGMTAVGTDNTLLTANGAAFATVDNIEWAALGSSRDVIKGSSVAGGGFYTANGADALSGNADMSSGIDTTLAGNADLGSLRFHNSGARSIDLNGNTLTTGGILITNEGNGATAISGGTLRGNVSASGLLQDLVVFQHETSAPLTIGATITNAANSAATGLTKGGAGTAILTAANSYTGETHINGGVLRITGSGSIGSGKLALQGGVLGIDTGTTFSRAITTGLEFVGNGGFAAYGSGSATVTLTGTTDLILGGTGVKYGNALILGAADATGTIVLTNGLRLSGANHYQQHEIRVLDGSADVDAQVAFSTTARDGGWRKTGAGTILVAGSAGAYTGGLTIEEGTVRLGTSTSLPNRVLTIKNGTLDLGAFNHTSSEQVITLGGGAAGTTANITSTTGTFTAGTGVNYVGTVDNGATMSGLVSVGTSVKTFDVANGTAAIDLGISAAVSGSGGGITKTGAGTMRLSSGSNSYTGATNVNGGTLLLTGNIVGGAIAVNSTGTLEVALAGTVSSNSTLAVNDGGTLKGNGSIARATTVNAGGRIAPGTSVGTLSVADLTLSTGSFSSFEVESLQAGGNFDRIVSTGTISYGGTLEVDFSQDFGVDVSWDLFDGTQAGSSTFASIVDISGTYESSQLSFDGASGVLSVSAVPEPGSLGLIAAGAGLMLRRRRRS